MATTTHSFPPTPLPIPNHTLTLQEATRADIPSLIAAFDAAFATNLLFSVMRGSADPDAMREKEIKRWNEKWDLNARRHFKIVDETSGKTVAISCWWFPHTPTPEEEAAAEEAKNAPKPEPIPGANARAAEEFERQLIEKRELWVKNDMYLMNILAVDPAYQRLGLGAALLAPILKLADQEGRKTFIEALSAGVKLYRRYGWVETGDTISLDFTEFGAEGSIDILLMMREPRAGVAL